MANQGKVDFKPEEWTAKYRGHPYLLENALLLESATNEPDAETALLDILVKATFIEGCIQFHGKQKSADLLENLERIAMEEGKTCPFDSLLTLEKFLSTMDVLFLKHVRTEEYSNSGLGFRKFVRFLFEKLKLNLNSGNQVNQKNLQSVLDEFTDTIRINDEMEVKNRDSYLEFLKNEVYLDFSSLKMLAAQVTGFKYDAATDSIALTESATAHLPLRLPILAALITTGQLDVSRTTTGYMRQSMYLNDGMAGTMTSGVLPLTKTNFRAKLKRFSNNCIPSDILRSEQWVEAAVNPNNAYGQLEVFQIISWAPYQSEGYWTPRTCQEGLDFEKQQDKLIEVQSYYYFYLEPKHLFVDVKTLPKQ